MKKLVSLFFTMGFIFLLAACDTNAELTTTEDNRDVLKPVFVGAHNIQITQGDEFDPLDGVTATDNVDGDVTSGITVTGEVNINEPGTYYITYKVSDKAGNEKILSRQVIVLSNQTWGEITNGDFADGMTGWSSWFGEGGAGSVDIVDGIAKYTVTALGNDFWTSQFQQERLGIEKGKSYKLTFKAKADVARKMQVKIEDPDKSYHTYADNIFDLTTEEQEFSFSFTAEADTTTTGKLAFFLGLIGGKAEDSALTTVYISNVVMEETVVPGTIINGDFSDGLNSWNQWFGEGGAGNIEVEDGKAAYTVTAIGGQFWTSQFQQHNITLEAEKTYVLTFKASALEARRMQVKFELGSWFVEDKFLIATDEDTYTLEFTTTTALEKVKLGFYLGKIADYETESKLTTVYIDDVVLQVK